jgi:hypothetical protein
VKTPDVGDGDGRIVRLGVALAVAVDGAADGTTDGVVVNGDADSDAAVLLQPTSTATLQAHARTPLARIPTLCAS